MANHAALIRQENLGRTVTRRGRRFIEFDLGGGVRRYVATIDPLHVRGSETEIDTTFVADTGAWQWKLAQGDFQVHARSVFNAGNLVEWRHESGEWIIVDPQSINWINQDLSRQQIAIKQAITGVANDFTLSFPAGYGTGIDFTYIAHPSRLIKHITIGQLSRLPAPTVVGPSIWFEAEWTLSTSSGVDLWLDGAKWAKTNGVRVKTANRIEFRNTANTQVLWYADAPTATDANGETVVSEYEVRRQGGPGNLFITVRVPRAWLLAAAYPVMIDPTFTDGYGGDVATAKDTYVNSGAATVGYGVNALIQANSTGIKALLEFDLSSIDAAATCNSALFSVYRAVQGSANAFTLTTYPIASGNAAWVEGTSGNPAPSGSPCWNALAADGSGGVTTAWAGSAGLATSGTDYEASSLGTVNGNRSDAVGTEYQTSLTASRVAGWFGGSNTNYGVLVITSSADGNIASSDNTDTTLRPKLVVDYTAGGITVSEATQAQVSDAAALGVQTPLAPAQDFQAQVSDSAILGVLTNITVAQATQAQTSDAAPIYVSIGAFDNTQAQVSDAAPVSYFPPGGETTINPAQNTQAQVSDTAILGVLTPITAIGGNQAQVSDAATMGVITPLTPAQNTQAQVSDTAVLSYYISGTDATQAQASDAAILGVLYPITVAQANQAQVSDLAVLTVTGVAVLHGERRLYPARTRVTSGMASRPTHQTATRVDLEVDD